MKLFYADTETTGLDPKVHELFQLAFIIEVDGKVVEEVELKVRPAHPETISEEALKVTGKTRGELLSYPERRTGYEKLVQVMARHVDRYDRSDKLVWVGQNPNFDMSFVRAFFTEHGDKYFGSWWDNRPADLVSLAVACRLRGLISPSNFKLCTLCDEFGIQFRAHDALEDVRATREVFRRLMDFLPAKTRSAQ